MPWLIGLNNFLFQTKKHNFILDYEKLNQNFESQNFNPFQVEVGQVPPLFIGKIAKMKLAKPFSIETSNPVKDESDFLGSISAFVTKKDENEGLEKNIHPCDDSSDDDSSDDDTNLESETDDEEYQCVVCKLDFVGEDKFEQHRRITQHWG